MRLVFFGTPAFAVPSLDALVADGHQIALVVTQPDRPRGRSRSTLLPPPVKERARALGIPVVQPERPRGDEFLDALRAAEAELGVVVAYGHILKPEILAVPRLGMINVHASLLPKLRGAAPINWAILEGEAETGVSIMQMEAGLDSGPVLRRVATPIGPDETAGALTERLARLGAEALGGVVADLAAGRASPEPQDHARASFAPKVDRTVARIDWTEPAGRAANRIRAFDPAPGAWTGLADTDLKCFAPRVLDEADGAPGTVIEAGPRLVVATGRGALQIGEVQPAGRARMTAEAWLRGRPISVGTMLR
ncbi:MAG: methionyl-tRNA formyltransferase [Gemmatimonadales bacterium]